MLPKPLAATALALLALTACRTSAPEGSARAARSAPSAGRVVLLSLDGAGAEELERRVRAGEFPPGGLARFYAEGQVAAWLDPVEPTLTAVNHIAIATGAPPASNGIVGNGFHPAGSRWGERVSGFAAPIATETLWEAARRQGKRVGVWTFPGADDTSPRRRADWGMVYLGRPSHPAAVVELGAGSFQAAALDDAPPSGPRPATLRRATIDLEDGNGGRSFTLLALDPEGDEGAAFTRLAIRSPAGATAPELLAPGEWARLTAGGPSAPAVAWIKLLDLAPDLSRVRLLIGAEHANQTYPAELGVELARAGLVWPGPPDDELFDAGHAGRPGIDLSTWTEEAERFADFFLDGQRKAVARADWDLFMGYVPSIDEAGHRLLLDDPRQPGDSPENRSAYAEARRRVWRAVDRGLARLLEAIDLSTTTVVIVSDHGMLPIHTAVDLNVVLAEVGLATLGDDGRPDLARSRAMAFAQGGAAHVYFAPSVPTAERPALIAELRRRFETLEIDGERPVEKTFAGTERAQVHLDHPDGGDLILFARAGYGFAERPNPGRALAAPPAALGMHGHLRSNTSLRAIYLALGRGVRPGRTGPIPNVAVAGRVAASLGIEPPRKQHP